MESVIKESTSLYYEIDDCITKLIKARLDKDANKENKARCNIESLLVSTMQHISWLVGELKGCSKIKWQRGIPIEKGQYIITTKDGAGCIYFDPNDVCDVGFFKQFVIAWCKLSDIEPYKEDEK